MVPNAEPGYTVSEKRLNPITDFGQKALVTYDLGQAAQVEVVVEA